MPTADYVGQIMVIEDDPDTRANLCDILEMDAFSVCAAAAMDEALALDSLPAVDVIVLDRRLADGDCLDCLPRLRSRATNAAIVVVTAQSDLDGAIEALRHGASDYILKPLNPDTLRMRIGRIMEQRRLIRASRRTESIFRNLVEAAESLIVMLRQEDQAILYFSPFAEQLTGYAAGDVRGRGFLDTFIAEAERPAHLAHYRRACAGDSLRGRQCRITCRDGSTRDLLCNVRCVPDYDGAPALLIVGHDISELKQAQERALQSERMAAIGQMCAGLAHESRNALQRSQACLEMLALRLKPDPPALNLIARIQQAQDDLHRLYEDVREFAAPIRLVLRDCRLDEIWSRAWSHLEPTRRGRSAVLSARAGGTDLGCRADAFRLEQVFRNILDNALAACADGACIEIAAALDRLAGRPALRVAVRDNGPGLTPEQRERIFEAFYTTKTRGTGLGMAIVKRIVEAHGGRVEVGAGGPPGAEIVLTLPRQPGD
ncbi:MAG: ATP-binding protein [Isosphaeraceae bacterium]